MRIIKSNRNIAAASMPPNPYDIGPEDPKEYSKLDEFDSELELYFDEPVTIDEDGYVELTGTEYMLNPAPDRMGMYLDYDYNVEIADADDIYDRLGDELNAIGIGSRYTPGTYKVTGIINLVSSVSGIEYDDEYSGVDEDGDPILDRSYYKDDSEYTIKSFTVSDVKVSGAAINSSTTVVGYDDIDEDSWKYLRSKQVIDSDGMLTDYTLYKNADGTQFICMFGDNDLYEPDPDYADWEGSSEEEAIEWFDNYSSGYDEYDDIYGAESADEADAYDEIKEIGQEFTSENTSINSGRLPAVFNMINFEPGTVNLDYGGGKFDNVAEYLTQYDVINLVYDPYNRTAEHNKEVIGLIREHGGADTATCSNVLNVIKEPEVRLNVLQNIKKLVRPGGTVYITVYEGKGNAAEGPTKSGYQLNRKTADYMEEVQQIFPDARRKGKLIIATNSNAVTSSTDYEDDDIELITL